MYKKVFFHCFLRCLFFFFLVLVQGPGKRPRANRPVGVALGKPGVSRVGYWVVYSLLEMVSPGNWAEKVHVKEAGRAPEKKTDSFGTRVSRRELIF